MKKKKLTSFQLCLVAMAVGVNVAGGELAPPGSYTQLTLPGRGVGW